MTDLSAIPAGKITRRPGTGFDHPDSLDDYVDVPWLLDLEAWPEDDPEVTVRA